MKLKDRRRLRRWNTANDPASVGHPLKKSTGGKGGHGPQSSRGGKTPTPRTARAPRGK